jgi:hypothetical protein
MPSVKVSGQKPPSDKLKGGDVDKLRDKIPNAKKLSKARCTAVLAALELVKGEPWERALKRRGLKVS